MNAKRVSRDSRDGLRLNRDDRMPLQRQIYMRIRTAIEQRRLQPGERVSSVRALASELGVARGTVEAAYQQLTGEGYLLARGQAGTVVSPHLPVVPEPTTTAAVAPARGRGNNRVRASVPQEPPLITSVPSQPLPSTLPPPFQLGMPALDAFPRKTWTRLAARRMRTLQLSDLAYGDPSGHAPLRQAIATYLLVSRGIACTPEQVVVTAGYRASLALVARMLLRKGERVWVEDPCHPPTRDVLAAAEVVPVGVPVDAQGLVVEYGMRRAPKARMAIVTPSHQAPLGVSLALPRRLQLLDWASRADAWIVEDDYDGEYHYSGPPLPALKNLDAHDRVIYAGSFSKTLYPGLALGYLVLPERLADAGRATARRWSHGPAPFMQAIVADFVVAGHFSRHLKKMRLLYARRRTLLVAALAATFGDKVSVELTSGGMHLIARFKSPLDDLELAHRAQRAGLNCQSLSARYAMPGDDQGLLIGFTNVASPDEAARLCTRLRDALDARATGHSSSSSSRRSSPAASA
ncbi:PLP-dependent aminotransferase family protein [Paraburkholderia flava]|uniref:MocR-like pyridoxine biosynthesis transcription factor PdxR n=1 Tax=Paraburkholderia flava TaxID=2547393 RepID=UPI001060EA25|nr:PLP-dependent aminotransferase family protein [Paraburkholderia flava]